MKNVIHSSAPNVLVGCLTHALEMLRGGGDPIQHPAINGERIRSVTIRPFSEYKDSGILASLQTVENPNEVDLHPGLSAHHEVSNSKAFGSEIRRVSMARHIVVSTPEEPALKVEHQGEVGFHDGLINAFCKLGKESLGLPANTKNDKVLTQKGIIVTHVISILMKHLHDELFEFPERGVISMMELVVSVRRQLNGGLSVTISLIGRHGNRILRYLVADQTEFFNGDRVLPADEALEILAHNTTYEALDNMLARGNLLERKCKDGETTIKAHISANIIRHGGSVGTTLMDLLHQMAMTGQSINSEMYRKNPTQAFEMSVSSKHTTLQLETILFADQGAVHKSDMDWVIKDLQAYLEAAVASGLAILHAGYQANHRLRAFETRTAIENDLQSI